MRSKIGGDKKKENLQISSRGRVLQNKIILYNNNARVLSDGANHDPSIHSSLFAHSPALAKKPTYPGRAPIPDPTRKHEKPTYHSTACRAMKEYLRRQSRCSHLARLMSSRATFRDRI
ncbi:serine hydroxymethyltransferase 2 [Striga asiatica]|uniref:Serine hydroxymethyltransferase 2 n=1 Tax=Striga asiatica TaxID=4170 RepID=A0A5A7PPX5_STRAF|nr:serine hydroxymethyltransferase 2 [Striga asiatica]